MSEIETPQQSMFRFRVNIWDLLGVSYNSFILSHTLNAPRLGRSCFT